MSRRLASVALALLLVTSAVAIAAVGGAVAAESENTSANETEPVNESVDGLEDVDDRDADRLTIDDLERGGDLVPGADPSMRWLSDQGSVYVDYPSADPLAPSAEEWEVQNVLGPGATVERDELTLNAERPRDAGSEEYRLVVVHWDRGSVMEDGERIEYAENRDVNNHSIAFDGPRDRVTIDLPNTDGESREVTMWLETEDGDPVDGARWTFTHQSAPYTVDAGIDTMGDLLAWGALVFVAPLALGIPVAVKGANGVLSQTGKGPMLPGVIYGALAVAGMFLVAVWGWRTALTAIVHRPLLFSAGLVVLAFWAVLEWGGHDTIRALFVRDELAEATSPSGEDVHDTVYEDMSDRRLVRTETEGEYVLVESGIRPFLARWFGVAPTLDVSELSTQIDVRKGKWDKVFVADPNSERALEYERPRLTLDLTKETDESGWLGTLSSIRWNVFAWSLAGGLFGWMLGPALLGLSTAVAIAGLLLGFLIPATGVKEGTVEFDAAPVHYTQARQVLAGSCKEYADAATIDELEKIAWSERSRTAIDARAVQSEMDQTVTEAMIEDELGLSGMFDAESNDDEPEEQTEQQDRQSRGDETDETAMVPADD